MASAALAAAVAALGASSPLNMFFLAVLVGSALHLVVSALITLKNVGTRVYVVVQLVGLWYILPPSARTELFEHVKTHAELAFANAHLAKEALVKFFFTATNANATATTGECT